MHVIQIKKGTRSEIEAAKLSGLLLPGEPYLIEDEGRLGVGLASDSYSAMALEVPRLLSIVSGTSLSPNLDLYENYEITALATDIIINNPVGNLHDFHKLLFRIKDNGSAKQITWGSNFIAGGIDLPAETMDGKISHIGFIWSSAISKWMCIASLTEE